MKIKRHGISIGVERVDSQLFLTIKIVGKLSHEDYKTMNPLIDSALQGVDDPVVRVFVDASMLEGWELRAAWDDLKFGVKHGKDFKKIAILGEKKWLEMSAKVADWFTSGEVKNFHDVDAALKWLNA